VFTGTTVEPQSTGDALAISAAALFERFPVALLTPADNHNGSSHPDQDRPATDSW
jgi:hypothetical protein